MDGRGADVPARRRYRKSPYGMVKSRHLSAWDGHSFINWRTPLSQPLANEEKPFRRPSFSGSGHEAPSSPAVAHSIDPPVLCPPLPTPFIRTLGSTFVAPSPANASPLTLSSTRRHLGHDGKDVGAVGEDSMSSLLLLVSFSCCADSTWRAVIALWREPFTALRVQNATRSEKVQSGLAVTVQSTYLLDRPELVSCSHRAFIHVISPCFHCLITFFRTGMVALLISVCLFVSFIVVLTSALLQQPPGLPPHLPNARQRCLCTVVCHRAAPWSR